MAGDISFDVVSDFDEQELRNALDQVRREVQQRYDFKGTDSSIELGESTITMETSSEDRLTALRTVLEEKLVKRKVSLKVLDYLSYALSRPQVSLDVFEDVKADLLPRVRDRYYYDLVELSTDASLRSNVSPVVLNEELWLELVHDQPASRFAAYS